MTVFSVNDGTATLSNTSLDFFIGSTNLKGEFPPTQTRYRRFTFTVKPEESGVLVFKPVVNVRHPDEDPLGYFQYYWENGKLIVTGGIRRPARPYSETVETGLMVSVGKWRYVTKLPKEGSRGNYKVVDVFALLRYLEGSIELKELERSSAAVVRREQRQRRLAEAEQQVKGLANCALELERQLLQLRNIHGRMLGRYRTLCDAVDMMDSLASLLRKVPGWLRPVSVAHFLAGMDMAGQDKTS